MRHLVTILLIVVSFAWGNLPAGAEPPAIPFGQSSAFDLNTNRIGFADSSPLVLTSAPAGVGLPRAVALGDPQPNPFNPVVLIPFSVGCRGVVELGVYDMRGRLVRQLTSGLLTEGRYSEQWDGRNGAGSAMPAGVYLVRIKLDAVQETRKISLVK